VAHVAFDRGHQVGDKVVAALKLDVDVGPGLFGALHQADKAVVDRNHPDQKQHRHRDNNP